MTELRKADELGNLGFQIQKNQCYTTVQRDSSHKQAEGGGEKSQECDNIRRKYHILVVVVTILAVTVTILLVCMVVVLVELVILRTAFFSFRFTHTRDAFAAIEGINNTLSEGLELQSMQSEHMVQILSGRYSYSPASSCAVAHLISPQSPSGYFWVKSSSGSAVRVYCDMTRTCGNITGGWMRVAELDMTVDGSSCPVDLCLNSDAPRTCRICGSSASCSSSTFSTVLSYSRVCGRIKAYQIGAPDAFTAAGPIGSSYVDGISLTYGSPKQHLWTFVAALNEDDSYPSSKCPCSNIALVNQTSYPPSFVGENYFCDTAVSTLNYNRALYSSDPLWDGAGCGLTSTCCAFNSPPWFHRELPQPTTENIDMRVCRDEENTNEDIAVEVVEIYVQ